MNHLLHTMKPVILVLAACFAGVTPAAAQTTPGTNPHGTLAEGLDCSDCHRADGWRPLRADVRFDHDRQTAFQLSGRHRDTACRACHLDLRFDQPQLGPNDCAACHVDVHQGTAPSYCDACHNTITFHDVDGIRIHEHTAFPLTGAHVQTTCAACHTDDRDGAFELLDTDCVSCHERDYAAAQSIDHQEMGFGTDCASCHGTIAWAGTRFDHAAVANGYTLVGAHMQIACDNCHVMPGFGLVFQPRDQEDCITCHEAEYQRKHGGSGYPTACLTCHNQNGWDGANFRDHDAEFFPIYSGTHKGEWDACSDCHQATGQFTQFTCLTCHEHEQSRTDSQHREVNGYVYQSTFCLDCHPRGRGEDDVFHF